MDPIDRPDAEPPDPDPDDETDDEPDDEPDEDRLAPAYRRALELQAAGATAGEIAARLEVPVEAIPSLLRLARAKAGAREPPRPDGQESGGHRPPSDEVPP
jgi:DNA-directed RNA polymerase specialized sigma24 family protein